MTLFPESATKSCTLAMIQGEVMSWKSKLGSIFQGPDRENMTYLRNTKNR